MEGDGGGWRRVDGPCPAGRWAPAPPVSRSGGAIPGRGKIAQGSGPGKPKSGRLPGHLSASRGDRLPLDRAGADSTIAWKPGSPYPFAGEPDVVAAPPRVGAGDGRGARSGSPPTVPPLATRPSELVHERIPQAGTGGRRRRPRD